MAMPGKARSAALFDRQTWPSAGANVSAITRSNGLDPSQLFAWRRKAKASGVVVPLAAAASKPVKFARFDAMRNDIVEIVIGDVVVRAGSDIEPRLADVIRAVRKA
jgi:transposase